jgi:hypothetical protein
MSDLRFFADTMHDLIKAESRLQKIHTNAMAYADACKIIRKGSLPRGDAILADFHKANEGLCAVRIIMEEAL